MKIFLSVFLLVIQMIAVAPVLSAEPTATTEGAGSEEFRSALGKWLDGNDRDALESLAGLARKGNTAAQILLARIASNGYLHRHLTRKMPRSESISLLRKPKGLSGQSWMDVAKKTSPVAIAFSQMRRPDGRADAIRALLAYGETTAAMRLVSALLDYGQSQDVIDILTSYENVPRSASLLLATAFEMKDYPYTGPASSGGINKSWEFESVAKKYGNQISIIDYLTWQPIPPVPLVEDPVARDYGIKYSIQVPALKPLVNFCSKRCKNSVQTCVAVGASLAFGLPPFPFSSPAESLVSNKRYWASARIDQDIARRLLSLRGNENLFSSMDKCLVPTLLKLRARDK